VGRTILFRDIFKLLHVLNRFKIVWVFACAEKLLKITLVVLCKVSRGKTLYNIGVLVTYCKFQLFCIHIRCDWMCRKTMRDEVMRFVKIFKVN
jgi:hypothetical protein